MDIEAAFTAYLLAYIGLTALIGNRLYPDETPQSVNLATQTAVVYQHISAGFIHTHQGQNKTELPNYQLTVYAPTRPQCKAIAAQIKAALCDYVGTMGGLTVQYIMLVNELFDTQHPGDGVTVSTCDLEFEIVYNRS